MRERKMHHRGTERDEGAQSREGGLFLLREQKKEFSCRRATEVTFFALAKKVVFSLRNLISLCASVVGLLLLPVSARADWAQDTLAKMSREEKIGQLLIMPACQLRGEDHRNDLQKAIQQYHIGGVILKQGTAAGQLELIQWLQSLTKIPLLCVGDAEWGLSMRLTDAIVYPKNQALGKLQDLSLIYDLGREIGRQCKRVGLHVNLAPVVDVNNNPNNPIIGPRSFGDDAGAVAERGAHWLRGHQKSGTAACAKHFPGHGDTSVDSHMDLPTIAHGIKRLESVELLPFRRAIAEGVECVMTAHLMVPVLDPEKPVTFSHAVVTDLLKTRMKFKGVVITDALNMKALANTYSVEEIALNAFHAGHDILLYGDHVAPNIDDILRVQLPRAFAALKSVSEEELDARVLKILRLKQKFIGPTPSIADVYEDLHTKGALELLKKL